MLSEHISSQIYTNFTFVPTIGQKKLIEKLAQFISEPALDTIFMVNGYAGTGKTSVMGALVETLHGMKINTVLMAPTGRAAKVMGLAARRPAFTIHKKIYRQKSLALEQARFDLNINKDHQTVYIVDEASILSNGGSESSMFGSGRLMDDMFRFIRSGRENKIILVGDNAQLPPVGLDHSPALEPADMRVYGHPISVTLDEVMRQEYDSGILFNATLVRCMIDEQIIDIPLFRTAFPDVKLLRGREFLEEVSDAFDRYGQENVIVITRSNKRANRFNEAIRRHALYREEEIEAGDMLMVVKNNYHYTNELENSPMEFIANGDTARLKRVRRYDEQFGFRFADVTLSFPDYDDEEIDCRILLDTLASEHPALTPEQNSKLFYGVAEDYAHLPTKKKRYEAIREDPYFNALQVKFAYAVTCHKAQGGQWNCVFIDQMLFGEETMSRDLLRWLYTAITRATEKVFFVNFDERFFK